MLNPTATGMLILMMHLPWEQITFHQSDARHHLAPCLLTDRHLSGVEMNSVTWTAPSFPSSLYVSGKSKIFLIHILKHLLAAWSSYGRCHLITVFNYNLKNVILK